MGKLIRAISENGGFVVYAVDSTDIVRDMEQIHKTSATATAALGRLLTAAALMGSLLKGDDERLTLRVNGDGPLGYMVAVGDANGNVKGYCQHPLADAPINEKTGKLDVSGIVGHTGTLYVIKDLGLKEPYVGQVPIVSGEIAEDITNYYATSEQTPTACALGVLVNPDLSVKVAGGFILQLLPGASDAEIAALEENLAKITSITSLLDSGVDIKTIALDLLDGFNPQILDESSARYRCSCSEQRMKEVLISLGKDELETLAAEGEDTEIVCNFCGTRHNFTPQEILALIEQ